MFLLVNIINLQTQMIFVGITCSLLHAHQQACKAAELTSQWIQQYQEQLL